MGRSLPSGWRSICGINELGRMRPDHDAAAMKIHSLHAWDLTPTKAVELQRQLADDVDARTPLPHWELVAGADVSYNRFSSIFYAGVVVWRRADGAIVEKQGAVREVTFPYVPGLLSFR